MQLTTRRKFFLILLLALIYNLLWAKQPKPVKNFPMPVVQFLKISNKVNTFC